MERCPSRGSSPRRVGQKIIALTTELGGPRNYLEIFINHWAHGVVVSHPLCMRKALGSIPSVSICVSLQLHRHVANNTSPPVGLEPTIFGLEVRRLVH